MPNPEHLARLKEGVEAWNQWKQSNPLIELDLSGANLTNADLSGADLSGASLNKANLSGADLRKANLSGIHFIWAHLIKANLSEADLHKASLIEADLTWANLSGADLSEANLSGADLAEANLSKANLSNAVLMRASLVETNLEDADLTGCRVYGISVWNAKLDGAKQSNLIITPHDEPAIQVDNLEVAQFIYLLLNNAKIRQVIDTITSKVVLILGRFTPERKVVLDAIREGLRRRDYVPVLFDFDKPASKNLTGTVTTLAKLARFIIADLTDPKSIPHELAMILPTTKVAVQPIFLEGTETYSMFADLREDYDWVLEPFPYKNSELLVERIIAPAEAKAIELRRNSAGIT